MVRLLLILIATSGLAAPPTGVQEALQRLDASARSFQSVKANLHRVLYTAIVKSSEHEDGAITLQKSKSVLTAKLDVTAPAQKSYLFRDRKLEIFYPKRKLVEEFDLGRARKLIDQLLLLGFGSSGKELAATYDIVWGGPEAVGNAPAWKVSLTPKSKEARSQLAKVELWYSDATSEPVQQKFYLPSGDFTLVTYSAIQRNPALRPADLSLNLPADVARAKPGSN
jgi:outer membrane lipoprotein-sorting protein